MEIMSKGLSKELKEKVKRRILRVKPGFEVHRVTRSSEEGVLNYRISGNNFVRISTKSGKPRFAPSKSAKELA